MPLFTQDTRVQALRQVPLFEGLSRKELVGLARLTEEMEIAEGTVLCREGARGHECFVIVDGEVVVDRGGKRISTQGAGAIVGEIALVADTPRTATVTATMPLRVMVLTRQAFSSVMKHYPGVQGKVLKTVASRLAELSESA